MDVVRLPATGVAFFTVTDVTQVTVTPVNENNVSDANGLRVVNDYNPAFRDGGSGSSTYVWRVRIPTTQGAPYGWTKYTDDTWHDARAENQFGYNPDTDLFPFQWSTGVMLFARKRDPGNPNAPYLGHIMVQDPALGAQGVWSYVATPNCAGMNDSSPPFPYQGVKADTNDYVSLPFTGDQTNWEFFYAVGLDYLDPLGTPLHPTRDIIWYDNNQMGPKWHLYSGREDQFESTIRASVSPYSALEQTGPPTDSSVYPVLSAGMFFPNPYIPGQLTDIRGTKDTEWNFAVTFQTNNAAGAPEVRVFISDDPTDPNGDGHVMQKSDPSNVDYESGVQYVYSMVLPEGKHYVYWTANDGTRSTHFPRRPDGLWPQTNVPSAQLVDSWGVDNVNIPGNKAFANLGNDHGGLFMTMAGNFADMDPRVNFRPVLSAPNVDPTSGGKGTVFTYKVKYSDQDQNPGAAGYRGDPPRWAKLVIVAPSIPPEQQGAGWNGGKIEFNMYKSTVPGENPDPNDYNTGVVYMYVANNLAEMFGQKTVSGDPLYGPYQYYFEFTDNWGAPPDPFEAPIPGETVRLPVGTTNYIAGPTVTENSPPTLTNPEVVSSDSSNTTATLWIYRVTYTDLDNQQPAFIKVYIDDPAQGTAGFLMAKQDPTDANYTDGTVYEYKTRLTQATHQFHFTASDSIATVRNPETEEISGPVVNANQVPHLLLGKVSPSAGGSDVQFVYSVIYRDDDLPKGQAPDYVKVYIDGTPYDMVKDDPGQTDYTLGAKYTYSTTLAVRSHTYHFEASDGSGRVVWMWNSVGSVAQEYRSRVRR
jgi:hypothetical protein